MTARISSVKAGIDISINDLEAHYLAGGNVMQITEAAQKAGVRDLRQSALFKVKNGLTSLAEINRVTKD